MATRNIINLIEKGNIAKDLKVAYSFMLLSRGYSADEVKVLDDYDFLVRKKNAKEAVDINQYGDISPRKRKQRNFPKTPVCLSSTSEVYNKRNHTLYYLNGDGPYTKGRLVLSLIKLYQQTYNPTFEEVKQLFNCNLNLLRNTVIDELSLEALGPDRQKRYYYHESDFVESKDGIRYAISNQWSVDKMDMIISFAHSIECKIELINPLKSVCHLTKNDMMYDNNG